MPLPQDDRIAFTLKIVSADTEVKALDQAKAQLQVEVDKIQKLDTANKNLFDPVNALVNGYQSELEKLNGITRTTYVENDIQESARKKVKNHFFPNDISSSVPSLAGVNNIWVRLKPYANGFAVGKTYAEAYPGATTKEADLIQAVQALITSAATYTNIQNTTGQHCVETGTCSIPMHLTEAACLAATPTPGIWTPGPDSIEAFPDVQTLKTNLVTAVNNLITFLNGELAVITSNDPDAANQAQNDAAKNDINNVIKPALNAWLAQPDFNTSHGQTSCAGFNSYNANLLAPTKLHSAQLTTLQNALTTRLSYVSTRTSQVTTALGSINQDLSTGDFTGSGLYFKRHNFLTLRLNALGGSLSQLVGLQGASNAQDGIKANIISTKATYSSIVPTSALKANANGGTKIHLVDPSFVAVGDAVYIYAEKQEELKRAIKSITGDMVELNDVVPAKYRTSDKARLYKDIS